MEYPYFDSYKVRKLYEDHRNRIDLKYGGLMTLIIAVEFFYLGFLLSRYF